MSREENEDVVGFLVVTEFRGKIEIEGTDDLVITQTTILETGGRILGVIPLELHNRGERVLGSLMAEDDTSRGSNRQNVGAALKALILRAYHLGHPSQLKAEPEPES